MKCSFAHKFGIKYYKMIEIKSRQVATAKYLNYFGEEEFAS